MGAPIFSKKKGRLRRDAGPLSPAELILLRKALPRLAAMEPDLDAGAVAKLLGLSRRTILDGCRAGDFPGHWKPSHNRVRIPLAAVTAFRENRRPSISAA